MRFVGRQNQAEQLGAILRGKETPKTGKLGILSIEGPGGIGKTRFFEHVYDKAQLQDRNFLVMRISGSVDSRKSVLHAIRGLVESSASPDLAPKPAGGYFPSLATALTEYENILREARTEFEKLPIKDGTTAEMVGSMIDVLVGFGKPINKLFPKSEEYVNMTELEKHRDGIGKALNTLEALKSSEMGFFEKLGWDGSATLRNALKNNPLQVFAQAMVKDLTAILVGYESKDFFAPKMAKMKSVDRLLLVVDDYEAVKSSLERFFIDHLFVLLKAAGFESTAVLIGRDRLADTSGGDLHHQLGGAMLPPIELRALERNELAELAKSQGIDDEAELARVWADTEGYPFFVQLWLEEAALGGRSALLLKRAYQRTTKWMSDEERRWLAHALTMEDVNIRQFRLALGDDSEAKRAQAWFEGDASIRDPHSQKFRVREYLRSRLLDYIEASDPDLHKELMHHRGSSNAA